MKIMCGICTLTTLKIVHTGKTPQRHCIDIYATMGIITSHSLHNISIEIP